jgi:hypothetical protein
VATLTESANSESAAIKGTAIMVISAMVATMTVVGNWLIDEK